MKTRFGFFSWGVRCQLCKQQVCSLCSTKMTEIDAEYDNAPAASNGLEQERPPNSLDVTSCYDHASPLGGNSGPVSLPIGFGRRAGKKK